MTPQLATGQDANEIGALIGGVFREYGLRLNLEEDRHLVEPAGWFARRGGAFWVVRAPDGTLAATVAVLPDGAVAELKCLYVRGDCRRAGVGRHLTEHVIRWARDRGLRRVVLWSDTRFTAAHRLYRRMGFRERGERDLADSNATREFGFEMAVAGWRAAAGGGENAAGDAG